MSEFLPENRRSTPTAPPVTGGADPGTRSLISKVFSSFGAVPEQWTSALFSLYEASSPQISVSQVVGLGGRTRFAQVLTGEDLTGTTSYSNLATAGPELTALDPGNYVGLWTAVLERQGVIVCNSYVSLSVNGTDVGDSYAGVLPQVLAAGTVVGMLTGTLPSDSNTVRMRYRIDDATATMRFGRRNLILLKVG